MKNVIHQYYKKEIDDHLILVRINPHTLEGLELVVTSDKEIIRTRRAFDEHIYNDLEYDDFKTCSPLEFNLYLKEIRY